MCDRVAAVWNDSDSTHPHARQREQCQPSQKVTCLIFPSFTSMHMHECTSPSRDRVADRPHNPFFCAAQSQWENGARLQPMPGQVLYLGVVKVEWVCVWMCHISLAALSLLPYKLYSAMTSVSFNAIIFQNWPLFSPDSSVSALYLEFTFYAKEHFFFLCSLTFSYFSL